MTRPTLKVETRKITGRKVKTLRRKGILPANLYGQSIKSQSLKVPQTDFAKIFAKTGESGLIDLVVDQAKSALPVLVGNIQTDPVTDNILHVDFRQVDLAQKTTVSVAIELVGEAPGIEGGEGVLIQPLLEVEVEALPEELPDHLELDVSGLVAINDVLRVSDIKVGSGVIVKAEANEVVAKIEAPAEEEEPESNEEEPEVIGEKDKEAESTSEKEGSAEPKESAKPEEKRRR
jgi:large subunit ribosomal protein L25